MNLHYCYAVISERCYKMFINMGRRYSGAENIKPDFFREELKNMGIHCKISCQVKLPLRQLTRAVRAAEQFLPAGIKYRENSYGIE